MDDQVGLRLWSDSDCRTRAMAPLRSSCYASFLERDVLALQRRENPVLGLVHLLSAADDLRRLRSSRFGESNNEYDAVPA